MQKITERPRVTQLREISFGFVRPTMHPELFLSWALILLATLTTLGTEVVVDDRDGTLGQMRAPVVASVKLSEAEWRAVEEGRLGLAEVGQAKMVLPVQRFATNPANARLHLVWLMPPGPHGQRKFALKKTRPSPQPTVVARFEAASGQYDLTDAGRPVLRYNYATIEPGDFVTNVAPASRIYAQARSDYIHPLFGLDGETLTKDWSVDHPHHRGIYWRGRRWIGGVNAAICTRCRRSSPGPQGSAR